MRGVLVRVLLSVVAVLLQFRLILRLTRNMEQSADGQSNE